MGRSCGSCSVLDSSVPVFTNRKKILIEGLLEKRLPLQCLETVGALVNRKGVQEGKLADRVVEGYMVGYGEDSMGINFRNLRKTV
jgi:hypothetical protein